MGLIWAPDISFEDHKRIAYRRKCMKAYPNWSMLLLFNWIAHKPEKNTKKKEDKNSTFNLWKSILLTLFKSDN